jgi:phosphoserine phosphatase RsbU/P
MNTTASKTSSPLGSHTITVLLVDDQMIVGEQVRRMLAPERDIVFHYCPDPTKAIAMATDISPTVILQDLVMPEIDGLTLVKFFRANQKLKDVPLIVLSTKEEAATKAEAFALGANDYLVKLPDKIELIARIRYHSRGYINLLERNEAYDALLKSEQALASELAQAAEHVISLLPPLITDGPIRTDWHFVPSAHLGGDAFGYHWLDADNFALYLLDVCDHGVGPALLSVSVLNVLRSQSLPNTDFRVPSQVLSMLNETFQMEKHNNLYFTMWYGVYNKTTGTLDYASSGNAQALLYTTEGGPTDLFTPNMLIGGMPDVVYKSSAVAITAPARLYIFSDGVHEVHLPDNTLWGQDRLKEFLAKPAQGESELKALYAQLETAQGFKGLEDDFSIMKVSFV